MSPHEESEAIMSRAASIISKSRRGVLMTGIFPCDLEKDVE